MKRRAAKANGRAEPSPGVSTLPDVVERPLLVRDHERREVARALALPPV